jgi:inositol hexakisphosphate/diphosphoinositol-pentakisphosphate kinase
MSRSCRFANSGIDYQIYPNRQGSPPQCQSELERQLVDLYPPKWFPSTQIFTSSERRVIASAEIFAAALLDPQHYSVSSSTSSSHSSRSSADGGSSGFINKNVPQPPTPPKPASLIPIVRKDLLDDSNAAKDVMDNVKKRLKILLRPGESEKRPELTWPKSMKKEPVEVVKVSISDVRCRNRKFEFAPYPQEVIELLSSFRDTMSHNFETLDVDKIQERW